MPKFTLGPTKSEMLECPEGHTMNVRDAGGDMIELYCPTCDDAPIEMDYREWRKYGD